MVFKMTWSLHGTCVGAAGLHTYKDSHTLLKET